MDPVNDKLELSDERQMIFLHGIKEDLQNVYDHFRSLEYRNEYLKKEIERLKSEHYKDEELAKMKKDYDRMKNDYYRGFPISEEEDKRLKKWMDEIIKEDPRTGGAVGGRFHYEFIPTGIGTIGTVEDILTHKKFTFQEP